MVVGEDAYVVVAGGEGGIEKYVSRRYAEYADSRGVGRKYGKFGTSSNNNAEDDVVVVDVVVDVDVEGGGDAGEEAFMIVLPCPRRRSLYSSAALLSFRVSSTYSFMSLYISWV